MSLVLVLLVLQFLAEYYSEIVAFMVDSIRKKKCSVVQCTSANSTFIHSSKKNFFLPLSLSGARALLNRCQFDYVIE